MSGWHALGATAVALSAFASGCAAPWTPSFSESTTGGLGEGVATDGAPSPTPDRTQPPATPTLLGDYWVVRVNGSIVGDFEPHPDPVYCDPAPPEAIIDFEGKTLRAAEAYRPDIERMRALGWTNVIQVPDDGCGGAWASAFNSTAGTLDAALPGAEPFLVEWSLVSGGLQINGQRMMDGQQFTVPLAYESSGIHWAGNVTVTVLGPWPLAGVQFYPWDDWPEHAPREEGGYWRD